MRIQFGTWIRSCDFVSNPGYGNTLGASTSNGYYTIVFDSNEKADLAYKQLLEKGYYDATNNEYWN